MPISKAVITVAGDGSVHFPLQVLIDRDGVEKSVLNILLDEVVAAGVETVCLVVGPGEDTALCAGRWATCRAAGVCPPGRTRWAMGMPSTVHATFVGAIRFCTWWATISTSATQPDCAQALVALAEAEACTVSAVQATRESLLPYYGAIGGAGSAGARTFTRWTRCWRSRPPPRPSSG